MVPELCLLLALSVGAGPTPYGERVPPVDLSDLGRFPPRQVCIERACFLTEHLEWVRAAGSLYPHEVGAWLNYYHGVKRMRAAWLACEEAAREDMYENRRLQSLRDLRELLGLEDYYRGRMPWWGW